MTRIEQWLGLSRGVLWFSTALLLLGAAGVGGLWWLVLTFFPHDDPVAILHYSSDVGIDFIGEGMHITALPQIGLLVLIMNTVLGLAVVRADRRAALLLWSAIPVVAIILLGAFYFLWRINA